MAARSPPRNWPISPAIMAVASAQIPPPRLRPSRMEEKMRAARTCYDHLAGRLGVALPDTLVLRSHVALAQDGGEITEDGFAFLEEVRRRRRSVQAVETRLLPTMSRLARTPYPHRG